MSDIAIRIENLGKEYRIGGLQKQYRTVRETITDAVAAPFRRARSLLKGQAYGAAGLDERIWALRHISFDVNHGEVIGIIGRNGAGKSTLLKVLSRITDPTEGAVDMYGRVGALLEVGTGFHLELTGRENIYLNGAILGMTRQEINQKFDEMVAFAEVEKFIDTPVKHYSSGMRLRLGFAVAAHLEPEILVVDEVLAVGDIAFQKKCIGKMGDVADSGRTVLFVSHNMAAVRQLCQRGIILDQGTVVFDGDVGTAVSKYQQLFEEPVEIDPDARFSFSDVKINGEWGEPVDVSQPLEIEITLHAAEELGAYRLACVLENATDQVVFNVRIEHHAYPELAKGGTWRLRYTLPSLWLRPGPYALHFKLFPTNPVLKHHYTSDRYILDVISPIQTSVRKGLLNPQYNLDVEAVR